MGVSIQRTCRHCGRRFHGTTPGAMTIMLDGQPFEAAIVLCAEGAIDVRRALDELLSRAHRRAVAQHAQRLNLTPRTPDQTAILRAPSAAETEHFAAAKALIDEDRYRQETQGTWPPRVTTVPEPRRNLRSVLPRRKPS